jgi:hypothetical protein
VVLAIIIGCVILWAILQNAAYRGGIQNRSRGSLRYQRRQARKLGIDPDKLEINSRAPIADDYDDTKARVNAFAKKWLLIPTILLWAFILWAVLQYFWQSRT